MVFMFKRKLIAGAVALTTMLVGPAVAQDMVRAENLVSHELISESRALVPGETHWIALRQTIEPDWHTYWENAGDAGGPTRVEWTSDTPISISPIHWPTPKIIPYQGLISHAYEDEALLLMQVALPEDVAASSVTLNADIDYLVCADICIPGSGTASLTLPIAPASAPSEDAPTLQTARALMPGPVPFEVALEDDQLTLSGRGVRADRIAALRFLPSIPQVLDHNVSQPLSLQNGFASLQLTPKNGTLIPEDLSGLLLVTEQIEAGSTQTLSQGFTIALGGSDYSNGGAPLPLPPEQIVAPGIDWSGIGLAIGFAFLGGLILNLMPCVFPILSIKAMAIAQTAGQHGRAERSKAYAFLSGVLLSFAFLAALFLGLRASGAALGWGFQFQSPAFVAAMAALFFALSLNMLGLFEIRSHLEGSGDGLTRKDGASGSFFTGALATVAATPCTAPFMGAALGFAITQPAAIAFAIIMALGLGFAAPMTALGLSKRFSALLPRPGGWMVTLRRWLSLPLLATVAWLAWVLWLQTGSGGLAILLVGLIAIGLALALVGRGTQGSARMAGAVIALLLGVGVSWAATTQVPTPAETESDHTSWSSERVATLQAEGRSVFIDFTAAWCITCKVNEAAVIDTDAFRSLMAEHDAELLVADWTVQDPKITKVLEQFGRAGVPLYLVYTPESADPQILPQVLTLDAVHEALATSRSS